MITERDLKEKYWYKSQLVQFCKDCGLPCSGTKAALLGRLGEYLTTGVIPQKNPGTRRRMVRTREITQDTCFLEGGLRFNRELREFFCRALGRDSVRFSKHMAAAVRKAEQSGTDITVGELLDIWQNPPREAAASDEDETYQWNRFVKDFHRSPCARSYREPLKVAAILWTMVRESREEKIFTEELLDRYRERIAPFLKD